MTKYVSTLKYQKSPKGVLNIIYRNQLLRQKRKNIKVTYTYKEFKNRYLNDEKYNFLYKQWVLSNYDKNMKPSFDRIDNKKCYSFDNLQIMTWRENNAKGRRECMKAVRQYDLSGNYIKTYSSIIEASKEYNINKSNISACCKNKLHKTGGYIWKYAKE